MIDPNNTVRAIRHMMQEVVDGQAIVTQTIQEIYAMTRNSTLNYQQIKGYFGEFEYTEQPGGRIRIIDNWYAENIRLLEVGKHRLWVHKLICGQLAAAIAECISLGYSKAITFEDGGGGFCARHKMHDPKRGLSCHSWGIACDLSPVKYPYGGEAAPPQAVVQIFNKYGFLWGGNFRTPDNMHFQFSRFLF